MVEEMEDMGLDTSEVAKRPVKRARSRVSERAEENEEVAATIKRNKTHSRKPQKDTANLSPALQKKAREASQVSQRRMASLARRERAIATPPPVCRSTSIRERERMELTIPGRIAFIVLLFVLFVRPCLNCWLGWPSPPWECSSAGPCSTSTASSLSDNFPFVSTSLLTDRRSLRRR